MMEEKGPDNPRCDPREIAIKSLFLGPQSENARWFSEKTNEVLSHVIGWRKRLFPEDGEAISEDDQQVPEFRDLCANIDRGLAELLQRLESETPKFTPRYIGHMVSEISLPALLAEFALLLHNPNNASYEAAKVGLVIEREAIAALSKMLGFVPEESFGHFTSCGTIANFEALWRALYWFDQKLSLALYLIEKNLRSKEEFFELCHVSHERFRALVNEHGVIQADLERLSFLRAGPWQNPAGRILGTGFQGPVLLVPGHRHYSWPKAAGIFGLGTMNVWTIQLDSNGRLDLSDLKEKIARAQDENRPIVAIVSVLGTTELGEIDPVADVQLVIHQLKNEKNLSLWHHVDAAYGGYFTIFANETSGPFSSDSLRHLAAVSKADTVTIDPHKLGYVPYACGAIIARDKTHYGSFQVGAPYLKEAERNLAGWTTTLEGSRSAAGGAAVWLTAKVLPFSPDGFGRIIAKSIEAKNLFEKMLSTISLVNLVSPLDTNVICFAVARKFDSIRGSNRRTLELFARIESGPHFSVSRTTLLRSSYSEMIRRLCKEWEIQDDDVSDLSVVRLVLMNPFIVSKEMRTDFAEEFANELKRHLKN